MMEKGEPYNKARISESNPVDIHSLKTTLSKFCYQQVNDASFVF